MDKLNQDLFVFGLTPAEALVNLSVAFLCSLIIALLYSQTYKGISYSGNYVISLIMLALITSLVIMSIGNNLARAFGLVGAMSIIRFRTAVKDIQDIMFIFFALAIGLACGAGMYAISLTGTLFISVVVFIISIVNSFFKVKREYLVQLIFKGQEIQEQEINKVMDKYCSKSKLVNLKKIGEPDNNTTEYSYYVVLKRLNKAAVFTTDLNNINSVIKVNVFFDED